MEDFLQQIDTLTISFAMGAVLLPLLAAVIGFCLPARSKVSGWLSTLAILLSAVLSVAVFSKVWNQHPVHQQQLWFTIGETKVYAGILLNNLSVLMLVLVSVVALPVHIYSTAYMKNDERYGRYFTYLSFFCFSMLALVVTDSLVLFYAFWELVGFSSYLLIGFWRTKQAAVLANKKAFIMNRIGDIGLLSAIIIIYTTTRSFDINQLFGTNALVKTAAGQVTGVWQYIAFGGLFLAVAAKSAQFPLHTWLPDAMEGPTSISALIHAATMVAAGVFLLGRFYPVFTHHELTILAIVGCFTAFMAATIALTKNDLKRILAYSTISQLGYMVMAMGIGAYSSSLFHLATHAFFKCLLFLAAGIIIHEVQHVKDEYQLTIDPQNILYMGGLRKKMPLTFIACIIGGMALVGLPFTSGYLSKDGILIQSFEWSEGKSWVFKLIPIGALVTSWLTAFYVARLIAKVFFGEFKMLQFHPSIKLHISDGGWQYRVPLIFLTICSLFLLFSLNPILYERAWILTGFPNITGLDRVNIYHTIIPVLVNLVAVLVLYWAWSVYIKLKALPLPESGFLFRLSYNEWYIDKLYQKVIIMPVMALSKTTRWADLNIIDGFIHLLANIGLAGSKVAEWCDRYIIDGILHLTGSLVMAIGNFARRFQNGRVQYYLFSMLAVILVIFILKTLI
ncbi:NADH-quinone oxidoreductase subunit L [Mucilaginibacter sp.]|uniref:NADH-quinone oxidoreductase subunit 5 family protein n=1 Tax=Mucilaginibacter sp. TaxID=1882438 RepID=UPI002CE89EF1|nr:NADH-quinone oxidoreductase subunit L [Mucilaginibacter sp.]HTI57846.1 NADH-quinone oxidoreductase subunit L [Mucilaginibacter sp.]